MATQSELIDISDMLGMARIRLTALLMASDAIAKHQRDAIAWMIEDADHMLDQTLDKIEALRAREGKIDG